MAYNLLFVYTSSGNDPALVHVNAGTDAARTVLNAVGISPKSAIPLDGMLYFASGNMVYKYDPTTGALSTHGQTTDTSIYCGCAAPDGILFFGTFDGGGLCEYDPATDTFTDHGRMDAEGPDYQYGYSIGADAGYVYVQLGQNPWYLGVYNRSTGTKTLYSISSSVGVQHGTDGSLWFGSAYKLIDGEPVATLDPPDFVPYYWRSGGSNWDVTTWPAEINVEVNLDDSQPVNAIPATLYWRNVGEETWNEYEVSTLPLAAQTIHRLYAFDATRLLCLSTGYGPVYLYTPSTSAVDLLGWTDRSLYAATKIGTKWYLSGYPASTMEYDPSQPWTLVQNSADRPVTNPRDVLGVAKYHYFSVVGSDDLLYVGVHHERDSVGGSIGWFNPADDSTGSLRAGLETLDPRGLVAVGDTIVYSGLDLEGGDGQLVIFDTVTKSIVDLQTPLPDLTYTSPGALVAVSATDVIGLAGTVAYRWNIVTGAQVWRIDLPDNAMGNLHRVDRRAEVAPDGLIYFYCGASIYRLSPDTGTLKKVVNDSTQGSITWHEGTAYICGTTNLRRLVLPE